MAFMKAAAAALAAWLCAGGALAQGAAGGAANACVNFVSSAEPRVMLADFRLADLSRDQMSITFVGHSTFLIESQAGVRAATDYNDYIKPKAVPDIATMNIAHDTHFSHHPDPAIKHVLRGWDRAGGQALHDVIMQDMRVRNVTTNIRGFGLDRPDGNSIFVFEMAGLCVAHLGHLHHELTPGHLKELGQIDIVLAPVDGSWTLDLDGMMDVLHQLQPKAIIPMHYFSGATLERFLSKARDRGYPVERREAPKMIVSRDTLPAKTSVIVLPGR